MTDTPPDQIKVKDSVVPDLWAQTGRVAAMLAFGYLAKHFIDSEAVLGPVMAVAGGIGSIGVVAATYAWGIWAKIRSHKDLKVLEQHVPNDVAVLVK